MLYKTIHLFLKIETLHGILKFYLFSKCYITNIMLLKFVFYYYVEILFRLAFSHIQE